MNLSPFSTEELDQGIDQKSYSNPVGDAEGERHHQEDQKRRDRLTGAGEVNSSDSTHHHNSHKNEGRGGVWQTWRLWRHPYPPEADQFPVSAKGGFIGASTLSGFNPSRIKIDKCGLIVQITNYHLTILSRNFDIEWMTDL